MSVPAFEVLEHPADIGFRAFGASLPELFSNSAMAMLSIMGDPGAVTPSKACRVVVESADLESLMVEWLNEILYWFDGKRVAFREIRVQYLVDHQGRIRIEAEARGEPRDLEHHRSRLIVKAATYHQLKVEERGGAWVTEVYLDV